WHKERMRNMAQLTNPVQQTWELDSIFAGGSSSADFEAFLQQLQKDIAAMHQELQQFSAPGSLEEAVGLDRLIAGLQSAAGRIGEASSFVACLTAENQHDKKAVQLSSKVTTLRAAYENAMTLF